MLSKKYIAALLLALVIAAPSSTFAAIAYDNSISPNLPTSASFTMGSGTGMLLLVEEYVQASGSCTPGNSTAAYNSVSMTLAHTYAGSGDWINLFYLTSPASGSHTIDVSASSGCTVSLAGALSYSGAGGVDTTAFTRDTTSAYQSTLTSATANIWIATFGYNNNGNGPGASTNITGRSQNAAGWGNSAGDSNGNVNASGGYTQTWTGTPFAAGMYISQISITTYVPPPVVGNTIIFFQ